MPAVAGSETLFIKRLESMHDLEKPSMDEFEMEPESGLVAAKVSRSKVLPLGSSEARSIGKTRFTKVTLSKETSFKEPLSASRPGQKHPQKTFLSTSSHSPTKLPKSRASLKNSNVVHVYVRHLIRVSFYHWKQEILTEATSKQRLWSLSKTGESLHSAQCWLGRRPGTSRQCCRRESRPLRAQCVRTAGPTPYSNHVCTAVSVPSAPSKSTKQTKAGVPSAAR